MLSIAPYSIRFNEKFKSIFEPQQPRIVSLGRKIQCPDFQENQGKKRGPARQTERKIDKFKEGKSILDIFRVSNIYLGKFREGT